MRNLSHFFVEFRTMPPCKHKKRAQATKDENSSSASSAESEGSSGSSSSTEVLSSGSEIGSSVSEDSGEGEVNERRLMLGLKMDGFDKAIKVKLGQAGRIYCVRCVWTFVRFFEDCSRRERTSSTSARKARRKIVGVYSVQGFAGGGHDDHTGFVGCRLPAICDVERVKPHQSRMAKSWLTVLVQIGLARARLSLDRRK